MKLISKYFILFAIIFLAGCFGTGIPEAPFDYESYEFVPSSINFKLAISFKKDSDVPELRNSNTLITLDKRDANIIDIVNASTTARFAVGYKTGIVDFYGWSDFKTYKTIDTQSEIVKFDVNHTGSHLATIDPSFNLKLYNTTDSTVIKAMSGVNAVAFSPYQNYFAVAIYQTVQVYQYTLTDLSRVCEIPLAENTDVIQALEFPPMKGLIGVLSTESHHKASTDKFNIFRFTGGKSKLIGHYTEGGILDFQFFVPSVNNPRVVFFIYDGKIVNRRLSDFQNAKTLDIESTFYKLKISENLRNFAFIVTSDENSKLEAKSFSGKKFELPSNIPVDYKKSFALSPAGEALLIETDKNLKLINLEVNEFKIGNETINWIDETNDLENSSVEIVNAELQENASSPLERDTNEHNLKITLQNNSESLSRIWAEMSFVSNDNTFSEFPVYFGRIASNSDFTRNVKFKYPTGFLKGVPKIEIKVHADDKIIAKYAIKVDPTLRPEPDLRLNWYYQEKRGNVNGIIEPTDTGKINLLIHNAGRADAIITSLRIDSIEQDVLKIEAGANKIVEFTPKTADFMSAYVTHKIDIEYSNAFFIDSKIIKLEKEIYIPVQKAVQKAQEFQTLRTYVYTDFAYLRSAPSKYSHPLAILKAGSEIDVNKQLDDFYMINGFVNAAGHEIPVWIEKSHLDTSKTLIERLGWSVINVFAPENVYDVPPLITLQNRKLKELDTFVSDFTINVRVYAPEGLKTIKTSKITNGRIKLLKEKTQSVEILNKSIEEIREYRIKIAQDRNSLRFTALDANNVKSEYMLNLNLRKTSGNLRVLVIGISEYEDLRIPELTTAENGAKKLTETLKNVDLSLNLKTLTTLFGSEATKNAIESEIDSFVRTARKDDIVIIYFSGHSTRDIKTGTSFLIPYDAKFNSINDSTISIKNLQKKINSISSEQKMLIVDNTGEFDIAAPKTFASFNSIADSQTSILIASERTQRGGMHKINDLTLMTNALIEGILKSADKASGNNDGMVTFLELGNFVKSNVMKTSQSLGKIQTPVCKIADSSTLMPFSKVK